MLLKEAAWPVRELTLSGLRAVLWPRDVHWCIAGVTAAPVQPVITLSDNALEHLHKLRAESGGDELLLRIGVKSGGCSGTALVSLPQQGFK